jgi:DNA-binding SARP family transcriptional activator
MYYQEILEDKAIILSKIDKELRYTWVFNSHPDFSVKSVIGKTNSEIDPNPGTFQLEELKIVLLKIRLYIRKVYYWEGLRMNIKKRNCFIKPKYHFDNWRSQELVSKYNKIIHYPLTVIEGGIGTGKSSSLSNFLDSNFQGESIWFTLSEQIDWEVNLFWRLFLKAIIFYNNSLEEDIQEIIIKIEKRDSNIRSIINDLAEVVFDEFNDDSLLIIDNFELIIKNQKVVDSLSYFVNLIPNYFHLVLITKEKIDFPHLDRWQAQSLVQFIKEKQLILEKEDIKELLSLEYNLKLSNSELDKVYHLTEGWILAVDLFAKEYNGQALDDFLNDDSNFTMIDDYFSYYVLAKLEDKELIEFLLKTSLLEELDIRVSNLVLKIDNSQEIINLIKDKFGLIKKVEEGKYRYHNLFREFLKRRFDQIYVEFNHRELIDIYLELGMLKEALCYSYKIDDKDKLIAIILGKEERVIAKVESKLLETIFSYLTEEDFINNPLLYLYHGDYYLYKQDPYKSLANYQQGEKLFRSRGDRVSLRRALFKTAKVYAFFNSNHLLNYLEELLTFQDQLSIVKEEELTYLRYISTLIRGDMKEGRKLLAKLEGSNYYEELLTNHLFMKGDFNQAIKLIKQIDKPREEYFFYNTFIAPILIHLLLGNFYQAQEYILIELEQDNFVIKLFAQYYLAQIAEFFYIKPRVELKELYLEKLEMIDGCPYDSSWYRLELLLTIVFWEVFYGDLEQVLAYGELGLDHALSREDKLFSGFFNKAIGVKYYFEEDLTKAVQLLKKSIDSFLIIENKLLLASSYLWIALVIYKSKKSDSLRYYATKFLKLSREHNYDFLLTTPNLLGSRDPNHFIPLLLEVKSLGVEVAYIDQILNQLHLERLDNAPGYSLRIKSLGRLQVYRGTELITEDDWGRKKAKELFKLLLINYGQLINKDQICQLLYPDYNQTDAYRNFSVNLTYLNNLLEPSREAGEKTYFIVREGDYYGLTNKFAYFYDVDMFQSLINRGRQADNKLIRIKYYQQALELYEDDFIADDLYNEEISKERKRIQHLYLKLADDLMEYYYDNQDYHKCIKLANKSLEIDKYFESAYLYQLKAYKELNLRSYAIKAYKRCKDILEEELNISPNQEIEEYYKSITK